jgi:predicted RNase H-like nuclease
VAVLGVDGWRGSWVGALLEGREVRLLHLPDAAAVLAVPGVDVIAIDMPIGLSEDGDRTCDRAAKAALGPAGSSVFPAPLRQLLDCSDYLQACAVSRATAWGKAPSRQAWNLVPSIRDLDTALGDPPDPRVAEVHPELSFRALAPQVRNPKVTARGMVQRLAALRPVMDVEPALASAPPKVPAVDCLDACAAAWSAHRLLEGTAESVGDHARDARGRPMRIWW